MRNIYFPEEEVDENDLLFVCFMIEKVARRLKQRNAYVVNTLGNDGLAHQLSVAKAFHCQNPLDVVDAWVEDYELLTGCFDVTEIDSELCPRIPTALDMGKVYARLILQTMSDTEDYPEAMIKVYNNSICETIDNYNCSAYYEPSYYIAESYRAGGFLS